MCGRKIIDRNRKRQRQYAIQTGYDHDYIGLATRQIFNLNTEFILVGIDCLVTNFGVC